MHAADQTGPGNSAGSGSGTEAVTRYIITRPCLAEGSLRLLKYLQPLFPAEGPVTLQDGKGERFAANVELARGRLTGLGELYRAHNMGVNDVLLLSRAEEGRYRVECVVKPHARPQPAAPERPAPAPPTTEKRVVIHATPHVREVRVERVPAEPLKAGQATPKPQDTGNGRPTDAASDSGSASQPAVRDAAAQSASSASRQEVTPRSGEAGRAVSEQPASRQPVSVQPVRTQPVQPQKSPVTGPTQPQSRRTPTAGRLPAPGGEARPTDGQSARSLPPTAMTVQMQPASAPTRAPSAPSMPIQMNFPAPDIRAATVLSATSGTVQAAAAPLTARAPATDVRPEKTEAADVAREAEAAGNPEDQLAALARLTGYTCDHLGSGVVRLRAELGSHSYSVLIATTPEALTTPAWRESGDYRALLTPEHERPQDVPRFTYAALAALLEHAGMAPLTPVDLRGYWNTGSFDQESASSVAELVRAQLTQRRNFSHVLETLAQQPAHSLVHLPRLAERLGGGVSTAELHGILETLSRAPFLALTPLPDGQYYLTSEVRHLVQEFGAYAESMQRRLRPRHTTTRV